VSGVGDVVSAKSVARKKRRGTIESNAAQVRRDVEGHKVINQ
jgi:hypothetical protein